MHLHSKIITTGLLILMLLAMVLNLFCNKVQQAQTKPNSEYLNHNDTVKYVGIETCRSCHNDIYKTFIETGMGKSFDLATSQKSAGDFTQKKPIYDKTNNMYYYPSWQDQQLFINEYRLNGKDTIYKRSEKVTYIIGSGQHTNSHIMNVNGYLYQLPLTWYAQKKKWDLPPGYEKGHNVRFSREIGLECMSCHNALPKMEEPTGNKFVTIPQGIDCERCHGPGELHVKEKLAGKWVDTATQIDYTIVNPKKLSWELQIDVCQRCHLQGNAVLKPGKTFYDFKPGMQLSSVMDIYMPKFKGKENKFIMASHAQRLQSSQCFLQSKAANSNVQLTCITCHNPHVSVKVTGKQIFNNACGNCHQLETACKESKAIRMAKNNNCWGCHMPKSGTIDIPHVTVTDHRIQIPATTKTKKMVEEFAGIYCINNSNTDALTKSKAYLSYYEKFEGTGISLDSSLFYQSKERNQSTEEDLLGVRIHYLYLKQAYKDVIVASKDITLVACNKPWTCYRIGQSYQNTGNFNMAKSWYAQALKLSHSNLDFMNKLGASYIELNEMQEGIALLKQSLTLNPKQPEALTNLGFAYIKMGNTTEALLQYNKALALDPDFEQALINKAGLYNFIGNPTEAKKILRQLLQNNPKNEQVKQLLLQL